MAFIDPEEKIIIMDMAPPVYSKTENDYSLQVDEFRRLRDIGIKTVLKPMYWGVIEQEFGVRNWDIVDDDLSKPRAAGMKVLLGCYETAPACVPDEWHMRDEGGGSLGQLSPWNTDAMAYEEEFVREFASRYAGEDILLQNTLIYAGETLLGSNPSWCDAAGLASYKERHGNVKIKESIAHNSGWLREFVVDRMLRHESLLLELQEHNEIWLQLHPMIRSISSGTQYVPEVLSALRAEWPDVSISWLLYTFYEFPESFREEQIDLAKTHRVDLTVGAMHCKGLRKSVPQAKASGIRLLCGPLHYNIMRPILRMEDWMFKELEWAMKEFSV